MKTNVSKIKLTKKSQDLLLVPILEQEISEKIVELKHKLKNLVIIGAFILNICSYFSFECITRYINKQDKTQSDIINSSLYSILSLILFDILSSLIIGITIDMISLKSSQIISFFMTLLGLVISIISMNQNSNAVILSSAVAQIGLYFTFIVTLYIIYDTSYNFKQRILNTGLFTVAYFSFTKFVCQLLVLFDLQKYIVYLIINIIAILLTIGATIVLYYSYWQIEKERQCSQVFQKFQSHQGIAITLKKVIKYYKNQHVIYLVIMSFTTQLCTCSLNNTQYIEVLRSNDQISIYENILIFSQLFCMSIPGFYILKKICSKENVIEYCMRLTSQYLTTSIAIQVIICIVFYFQQHLSYYFMFAIFQLSIMYQGIFTLTCAIIYNQLLICLIDSRISFKCIGYTLISVSQDMCQFFFVIQVQDLIIIRLLILLILVLTKIYHEYYIYNKSFQDLEQQQSFNQPNQN
ncbi:hypothetical protein ABPG72_006608 [Tetrahymena utriculariae]